MSLAKMFGVTVAAIVLIATPLSAGASGSKLNTKLLTVSELPAGWSATYSGSSAPGPCGLSVFRASTKAGKRATASFADGSSTALEEGLATGSGELKRWRTLSHNLSTCHQTSLTEQGKMAKLTIGAMSFPKVSRTSRAFALTLTVTGINLGFDVVLFRAAKLEGFVGYGTVGSPDVTTVEAFVKAAVDKAEGKPVHLATATG